MTKNTASELVKKSLKIPKINDSPMLPEEFNFSSCYYFFAAKFIM
jgi:hypothetical protein